MLNIRLNGNLVELRFPYSAELVSAIKEIPGRRWNPGADKFWTVPFTSAYDVHLLCKRLVEGNSQISFEGDAKQRIEELAAKTKQSLDSSRAVSADVNFPVPDGLDYFPYQKAGIQFALDHQNILIGDEMGLGKTIQAIGVANADKTIKRIVVICPAAVKINWRREIQTWATGKISVVIGNGANFNSWEELFSGNSQEWLIINYDILDKWKDILTNVDLLILDESHYLKNPKAQRTKNVFGYYDKENRVKVRGIEARKIVALTGTPIPNRPIEGWTLFNALAPDTFKSWKYYVTRYCAGFQDRFGWNTTGASNLDELQNTLRRTLMIRRKKSEVLKELPPKIRQIIELPAGPEVAHLIRQSKDAIKRLETLEKFYEDDVEIAKGRSAIFEEMAQLRHDTAVAKIPQVIEFVTDALENNDGRKIIIFGWHYDVINALHEAIPNSVTVTGQDNIQVRQIAVDSFQNDPNVRVFIGNIRAAGIGITLTASSHVIFAELDWTPGNVTQAEDRPHRIGQRNSVLVQHLVLEGSLEARMAETIVEKQKNIDAALDERFEEVEEAPIELKPISVKAPEIAKQLPEGRRYYAVENSAGELTFFRITAQFNLDGTPKITWVDQQVSNDFINRGRVLADGRYFGTFKELYDKIVEDPEASMIRYGLAIGKCGYCGKVLTNAVSRERGLGPWCYAKAFGTSLEGLEEE